jgi:glycosyltransferase involved in cell wall biosynthesis
MAPAPFLWAYDNPWIGEHLRVLLQEFQPEVFHVISGYLISGRALRIASESRIPTVVTLTDFWFLCPRITMLKSNGQISGLPINPTVCAQCLGEERRRFRWLGQWLPGLMRLYWQRRYADIQRVETRLRFLLQTLNGVQAIICPSQFLHSVFIQAGIAPDRLIFSRQGRDFPGLTPEQIHKSPSDRLRIGYMGQITEIKGVHLLFEAARRLPGARLTVRAFGDPTPFPTYTARLERIIGSGPHLQLAGTYRGQEELARIFAELDVLVVPSIWYENSPNVILEAFAHRTPVIASRLGGMAELVQHEVNGLLFEPGSSVDLAFQIQRLLDEPSLLQRLQAGIEPIKTVAAELDELELIYHNAFRLCGVSARSAVSLSDVGV